MRVRLACGCGARAGAAGVRVRRACGGELPSGWAGLVGAVTHRGQFCEDARRKASLKNKRAPQSYVEHTSLAAKRCRREAFGVLQHCFAAPAQPSHELCGSPPELACDLRLVRCARSRFAAPAQGSHELCGSRPGLVRVMRRPPGVRPRFAVLAQSSSLLCGSPGGFDFALRSRCRFLPRFAAPARAP